MEGRKVHFCKSLGGGSRIPGLHLHLQLDRLVLPRATAHHPPRRGKERTLGLGTGFRAVRFGDADWGRGPRAVWRLFLCAWGLESSRLERDPSPRRGNRGNALVSLSVLSWPSSPFPAPWFLPPLGPLCLRACRVCCIALAPDSPQHTIWHSGSWNLGEHRTGRV